MRSSKSRSRNKSNRQRSIGNIINRVFDSSGPEGKVRGTPQQIIDKYLALARDAQLGNDRVAEQNFLQHAEHYTRLLAEAQREMAREQEERQRSYQQNGQNGGRESQNRDFQNGYPDRNERNGYSRSAYEDQNEAPSTETAPAPVAQPEAFQEAPAQPVSEAAEEKSSFNDRRRPRGVSRRRRGGEDPLSSDGEDDSGLVETPEMRLETRAPDVSAPQPEIAEPAPAAEAAPEPTVAEAAPEAASETPARKPRARRNPRKPRAPKAESAEAESAPADKAETTDRASGTTGE